MPTTTLLPNSMSANTFSAGGLTDIDEGTGSPDANWMTVASTADDPNTRVGFAGIEGFLDGDQTVNLWVRKFDATGGADPTVTVAIYEGTSLLTTSTISGTAVPDNTSGALMTGTWSIAGISDPSGVDIKFDITITSGGGGPNRRTGELGAVDWDVTYKNRRYIKFT